MPITASYFRCHAEVCTRIARAITDKRVAYILIEMAEDFTARAAELDALDAEERYRRVSLI